MNAYEQQGVPRGRKVGTHVYRPDNIAAVANNTTSAPYRIDFSTGLPAGARVVAMSGSVLSGLDSDMAALSVALKVNGQEDFCTTGQSTQFATFFALFPRFAPWFTFHDADGRLGIPIIPGEAWFMTFKNEGSGGNVLPALHFKIVG